MLLLRYIVKLGCEPSSVGTMCGGASPMDPIFWMLHPIFEKALHVLWQSPQYRDTYDFTWEGGTCHGSKLNDGLPFTGELRTVWPSSSSPFLLLLLLRFRMISGWVS